MLRVLVAAFTVAAIVLVAYVAVFSWSYYRRALQVRTFADMQVISKKISDQVQRGVVSFEELQNTVVSVNSGRDAWGNDFLLEIRDIDQVLSCVLVSRGSDGNLDVDSLSAYFDAPSDDIRRQYPRDIVFRDGKAITIAGK
jgi:hypothetical protein